MERGKNTFEFKVKGPLELRVGRGRVKRSNRVKINDTRSSRLGFEARLVCSGISYGTIFYHVETTCNTEQQGMERKDVI